MLTMKMDILVEINVRKTTTDELGGEVEGIPALIGNLNCLFTPVTAQMLMKDYGIVSTKAFKVFTMDSLPDEEKYPVWEIRYLTKDYKILQINDYGKFKMLLVEEADHE